MKLIIEKSEACAAISLWVKEYYGVECKVDIFVVPNAEECLEIVGTAVATGTEGDD